jgi:hypothetical protein
VGKVDEGGVAEERGEDGHRDTEPAYASTARSSGARRERSTRVRIET